MSLSGYSSPAPPVNDPDRPHITHALANLLPRFEPEAYATLKEDVRQHGVRLPILVTSTGEILDGRHRAQACRELGVDCPTMAITGEDDLFSAVLSLNHYRRHLPPEQLA